MKNIITLFLIMLTTLLLISCSNKKPTGEVYDKEFRESYQVTRLMPMTIPNGKSVTVILIPYIYTYPDRYVVKIKWFAKDKWNYHEYFVDKETWHQIEIGQDYNGGSAYSSEPYTREKE